MGMHVHWHNVEARLHCTRLLAWKCTACGTEQHSDRCQVSRLPLSMLGMSSESARSSWPSLEKGELQHLRAVTVLCQLLSPAARSAEDMVWEQRKSNPGVQPPCSPCWARQAAGTQVTTAAGAECRTLRANTQGRFQSALSYHVSQQQAQRAFDESVQRGPGARSLPKPARLQATAVLGPQLNRSLNNCQSCGTQVSCNAESLESPRAWR